MVCNKCGKTLDLWDNIAGIHIKKYMGYGSSHDGENIAISLCLSCADSLIDQCVVSPVVDKNSDYDNQIEKAGDNNSEL